MRTKDELFAIGVMEIAQRLHMSHTGSADALDYSKERDYLSYLRDRLENWHSSTKETRAYDKAVRALLEAVMAEFDR